ncbi:hypothetical protein KBD09_03225 [Candidatus Woesebacteria bacterium]|nr:hypothetical protein [Candidatus Woesebacteria bacterium]
MFVSFLSSISKVAVVAFLFTFVAILIELFLISRKEKKKEEKKDVILPDFKENSFKSADTVSNTPLTVKKAAIEKSSKQISAKYVIGLVGLCVLVFIVIAVSIIYKGNQQEELVDQVPLPTRAARPSIAPTVTQGVEDDVVELLDFTEDESGSDEAGILAQAPSPTAILVLPTSAPTIKLAVSPSVTPMVLKSLTLTPTAMLTSSISTTPTKSTAPTLLKTGGSYSAGLFAAVLSFALIAFAFMF